MGSIHDEVSTQHVSQYPREEEILEAFLPGFSVTWGKRRKAYNAELSVYFLNPEPFMKEAYGFDQEIMLVYSQYSTVEPRSIQASESFMADDPARGRVEKLTYFFVSEAADATNWFQRYSAEHQESRLIIPFAAQGLRDNSKDAWYVRNVLGEQLYGRDLFDYRLPLENDIYFFGRAETVLNLFEATKRSENRGIFGLRKTGKTSLLYKLERTLKVEKTAEVFYFDCKLPSIRKLRWNELLAEICRQLNTRFGLNIAVNDSEQAVAKSFIEIVSRLPGKALMIFDEVEYISPVAIDDAHWHKDFIAFWQTFWACQSRHRTISALIAGVNPSVVETDSINGIQNPLFGIVSYQYLKGLNLEDTRSMIRTLGKRMGLKFRPEASEYVFSRYGGHPLLTRIACSILNTKIKDAKQHRPVEVTPSLLSSNEDSRDDELLFYCRHVVSELKQFYPDEYAMLEFLASGQTQDFIELSSQVEFVKHLESYGLIKKDRFNRPTVAVPVVGRYVALELAKREGRKTLHRIVPVAERASWIEKRRASIIQDLRTLEKAITAANKPSLFGPNSIPEADRFCQISACSDDAGFEYFINVSNRCFVESIENYGDNYAD